MSGRFGSRWALLLIVLLSMTLTGMPARGDGGAAPIILIPPFETGSSRARFSPMGNSNDDARGVLEDLLVNKKLKVVERERVDAVLKESEFSGKSTMADTKTAVKMGKMLGASALVMGTILNVSSEVTHSNGYGVRTQKTTVKASVRIRVVDISSGEITFSKVCNAQQSYDSSTNGGFGPVGSSNEKNFEVVKAAIEQVRNADDFFSALRKSPAPGGGAAGDDAASSSKSSDDTSSKSSNNTIEISFEPTPAKCDVMVDGEYRGTTPLKLKLPTSKSIKVQIRKAGFQPWEATMTPSDNMRKVNPELGPVPAK